MINNFISSFLDSQSFFTDINTIQELPDIFVPDLDTLVDQSTSKTDVIKIISEYLYFILDFFLLGDSDSF